MNPTRLIATAASPARIYFSHRQSSALLLPSQHLGLTSRRSSPYVLRTNTGIAIPNLLSRHSSSSSSSSSSPFRLSSNRTNNPNPNPNSTPSPQQEHVPPEELGEGIEEYYSPYKPKRQWPPDMTKLSPKHQFRLERKYRRRAALKYARPKWAKATKLMQWGSIGFILIYAVLFMEWDEQGSPFEDIRKSFFAALNTLFSAPPPPSSMRRADDKS